MKLYGVYFSPTGGTKKVLDTMMSEWDIEQELIDLTVPSFDHRYEIAFDDICMIAVPCYGGRIPDIVIKRLAKIKGDFSRIILIVVYGNRDYDDALLELRDVVKKLGFNPIAAIAAVAQHSIMNQFASNRPNELDLVQLKVFSREIINLVETNEEYHELKVPGNFPYRKYKGVPLKPKGNKLCTSCGMCAKICPVQAILKNNLKKVDKDKCITCMRCVKICPNQARKINPILLKIASLSIEKSCKERKENQLFFEME